MKAVVIVGALDPKGRELAFVKDLVEQQGLAALVVDFGILGEPTIPADVSREEVARAGGGDLEYLRRNKLREEAMPIMAEGLAVVARRLYDEGRLDAILGMGGGGGTSIATTGMRALPFGMPKVMVSTVAGGNVRAFVGPKDIIMMPSIVDVAGINRISARVYANAVGAIAGMLGVEPPASEQDKPLITASMFGNTTACVDRARGVLTDHGYEVLVFHATGIGGQTMEGMIADGYIAACLDITTTELADEVCGGGASAGPERCMAASWAGIPAVIAPGCVDMANFGALDSVPERYRERNLFQWTPTATLLRTSRLARPRLTLRALEPHSTKLRRSLSIMRCTSSRSAGTFCTSSIMIGCALAAGSSARTRSASVHGALVNSSINRVSSRSKRAERGNLRRSSVDLPVLRGPHRNADWPCGRSMSRLRAYSCIRSLLRNSSTKSEYNPNQRLDAASANWGATRTCPGQAS